MSIRLVDLVLRTRLSSTEKLVMLVVADAASDDGVAWPRQSTIAAKGSITERTVRRVLSKMEDERLVEIVQRGRNRSNLYRINVRRLRGLAEQVEDPVIDGEIPDPEGPDRASGPDSPERNESPVRSGQSDRSGADRESGPNRTVREPSTEPSTLARARERDEIFETVCEVVGIDWSDPMTKSQRGSINRAVKELREIDASPDQVRRVALAYRLRWPDIDLTPNAITKHWNLVRAPLPAQESAARARRSLMTPPDEVSGSYRAIEPPTASRRPEIEGETE